MHIGQLRLNRQAESLALGNKFLFVGALSSSFGSFYNYYQEGGRGTVQVMHKVEQAAAESLSLGSKFLSYPLW